jgi:signal transduction histidine kinase
MDPKCQSQGFLMTENWLLNWAIMAVSLFNTILLIWLGLTVLLNAERRTWGLWLAGGVILLGASFFLIHSVILGLGLDTIGSSIEFWWRLGWIPVVTIPYIWYVVILWYSGFWEGHADKLRRRHLSWFVGTTILAAGIFTLLIFANPLPSFVQAAQMSMTATLSLGGVPLLILIYPVYILLCIALSVDVLQHPAPSERIMGDLARRRARPWLVGAALTQILVSLLVGWVMFWTINQARQSIYEPYTATTIARFDLVIAGLISIAIIFLGQAVTSYEVFTGKALPSHGLLRYWHRAVILAGGYAGVISLSLTRNLHPVYTVLLSALLITTFYALLSWRSLTDRQKFIEQLRPFVTSQHIYEQVLAATPTVDDSDQPFTSLCQDVLGARQAYLAAEGPLAQLVGRPLVYALREVPQPPDSKEIIKPGLSPEEICVALPQKTTGDWLWMVPLWSERGLIGILLLGPKRGGGLYAQEEIEIARTVGERLIDLRASTEMARRLMKLQRQRLAESQVVDRRTRRVLHDEVLPQLHAALLSLNTSHSENPGAITALSAAHRQIADLLRDLPVVTAPDVHRLGLIAALKKTITNEFSSEFEQVEWDVDAGLVNQSDQISPLVSEVVYFAAREAIRNAARHGGVLPALRISAVQLNRDLQIVVEDNGAENPDERREEVGSGQGLVLHSTMMAVIGGELSLDRVSNQTTRVVLRAPLNIE